jgi:hypothetical protein
LINPSSTLLFPDDWSPTTTICGRKTSSPTPQSEERIDLLKHERLGEAVMLWSVERHDAKTCNELNVVRSGKEKRVSRAYIYSPCRADFSFMLVLDKEKICVFVCLVSFVAALQQTQLQMQIWTVPQTKGNKRGIVRKT